MGDREADVLKQTLPPPRVLLVCLPGQLFTVQAEHVTRLCCQVTVVVRGQLRARHRLRWAQWRPAIGADAAGRVEVDPPALRTLAERRASGLEAERGDVEVVVRGVQASGGREMGDNVVNIRGRCKTILLRNRRQISGYVAGNGVLRRRWVRGKTLPRSKQAD